MNKSKTKALIILAALLCCAAAPAVLAADATYDEGVKLYLKNEYDKALPKFQAVNKNDPANAQAHYYQALCYQQTDKDKQAATEYEAALANSKDPSLTEIIKERLARTKRRITHASAAPEETPAAVSKHDPVKKVIWFSTNWCSTCKRFAPSWEMGAAKFKGKLAFEHLNAEDPKNWKVVELYKPKAYPTLVFLDGKNKVIQNYADDPKGEEFIKRLQALGAPQ